MIFSYFQVVCRHEKTSYITLFSYSAARKNTIICKNHKNIYFKRYLGGGPSWPVVARGNYGQTLIRPVARRFCYINYFSETQFRCVLSKETVVAHYNAKYQCSLTTTSILGLLLTTKAAAYQSSEEYGYSSFVLQQNRKYLDTTTSSFNVAYQKGPFWGYY